MLHDIKVTVEEVRGKCTSGLKPGDYFILRSGRLYVPADRHFCLYALHAVLPLLPAKQRPLEDGDWLKRDNHVICPDPAGNVVMRIERIEQIEKEKGGEQMKKKILRSDRLPEAKGPYSVALTLDHLLFISGQGPAYPDTGEIVKGGFEEQARVTFENVRIILEEAGSSLDHALKVTVFLSNMDNFAVMNAIYAEYFKADPPVRTTVEVARLPFDIMLEVDVIAYIPQE